MAAKVLADKDVNAAMSEQPAANNDIKSMEYHRQAFHSKMAQEETYVDNINKHYRGLIVANNACGRSNKYISPSDNIMSPCSAKINALRNKHANKAKPKSLFAQASAKKLQGENPLGTTPANATKTSPF
ncbi:hypothetical protein B0T10DRAFT_268249 [Thelonectria olida]|uniref:Uncharacterized protein n=1 Tax=Thelonectria olida TaxID=1576542 RepID=A0A9P8W9F4_9HYPO|nr:hypothetical protein B0T10DRAFT_268249 [Thelonectria olida]